MKAEQPEVMDAEVGGVHRLWMGREDVLKHLGVTPRALVRMMRRGEVEAVRVGRSARYRVVPGQPSPRRATPGAVTVDDDLALQLSESLDERDALEARIEALEEERDRLVAQSEEARRAGLAERARLFQIIERERREHRASLDAIRDDLEWRAVEAEDRSAASRELLDAVMLVALELAATRPRRRRRRELTRSILELAERRVP